MFLLRYVFRYIFFILLCLSQGPFNGYGIGDLLSALTILFKAEGGIINYLLSIFCLLISLFFVIGKKLDDKIPIYKNDNDGILTKDEYDADGDGIVDDSDGDGIPDYLDDE